MLTHEIEAAFLDDELSSKVAAHRDDEHPVCGLLATSLRDRLNRRLRILGDLLMILEPRSGIRTVWTGLRSKSASVRAHAIELLDNLLEDPDERRILPLIENWQAEGKRSTIVPGALSVASELQAKLLHESDPWILACVLHWVGETKTQALVPEVASQLGFADPVVREAALRTFALLSPDADRLTSEVRNRLTRLQSDPDPRVRSTWLLARSRFELAGT
ncbi:MAG: hypothetical protein HC923_13085 [Myxococcales bacterium]|nr:hypothetical protein [Myxococcales bacterium]